jgi:formylglycine-generating enzyme required for sulfatase activity
VADIFISYSKQQPQPTRDVADFLTSEGYSVWWDTNLTAGEIFRDVINRQLDAAKAVIVIWAAHSVSSEWVIAEAEHADRQRKLIPLRTKDLDPRYIPKPYGTRHTDVVDNREAILKAVRRVVARAQPDSASADAVKADAQRPHDTEPIPSDEQTVGVQGGIPVLVGSRKHSETRWLLPVGGEVFCDVDGGPEMVVVPAGKFTMGSPDDEPEIDGNEGPRHEVTFARPFAVGRHAVTRGQFAAFVNATGHKTSDRWRNPGFKQDDSHPVVCIRWEDAKAYAAWLREITGQTYRLLTEAEWEYAARAGTTTPFWWGSSITPAQANYDGNYVYAGGGSKGEFRKGTVPVGSFRPNPWGLYNVHGNVFEWCEDTWHADYNGAPTDGSAWILGNTENNGRVARGGSWDDFPRFLRAANRFGNSDTDNGTGFRLARTLTS